MRGRDLSLFLSNICLRNRAPLALFTLRNFFIFVIIIRFFSFSTEVSKTHYVHIFHTLMDLFYYVTVDPA